ncbi:MAG TPA: SAM-dependent chlorinase/fluorinase [Bacteroidia bacterium]|jgi:S-adenosylmethionine hydrolase|nr:SAM-dependent chlorinase/fluorinase [Bacteroidia bacterium]
MPVITITSDFGTKDHYAASVRGALFRQLPGATFSEISNQVPAFDVSVGAYLVAQAYPEYPAGSIHIVAVNSGGGGRFDHVAVQMNGHFFVGCNNGIFSLISDKPADKVIQIAASGKEPSTFCARDLYVPAAVKLATGIAIEKLGVTLPDIARLSRPVAPPEENVLKGVVQYVDSFGNVITNISGEEFDRVGMGRQFVIELFKESINELHRTYADVNVGEKVAFFNSAGMLEIAMNSGNASGLLNLRLNSIIRIVFV